MTATVNSADPNNPGTAGSAGPTAPGQRHGLRPSRALTAIAWLCIVLGGLVAAVSGPLDLSRGSWLAAYLVLVGGLAQYAMGYARTWYPECAQPRGWGWAQIGAWNLGNVVVIGGALTVEPLVVDLGSMLLVIALAIALHATRSRAGAATPAAVARVSPLVRRAYVMLLIMLVLSIPTGMALSHLQHR